MTARRRRQPAAPVAARAARRPKRAAVPLSVRLRRLPGELGAMRMFLALLALLALVFAPRPGTPPVLEGWRMVPTLILPTLAPLVFLVLMLDALMARVHMTSVRGEALARYRRIVVVNLLIGLMLVGYWTPYFIAIVQP